MNSQTARYNRQMRLPDWGETGQKALLSARVLVVGAGGLGCPALQYLASAGVGHITIIDDDRIGLDNLHRQILFGDADVGRYKAELVRERLGAMNASVTVAPMIARFDTGNGRELVRTHNLILDCTDNLSTRFAIHDCCFEERKPLVQAALYTWEGQIATFRFDDPASKGCLRCLWDQEPEDGCVGTCADVGIAGAVAGVLGSMQAVTALRILLGLPVPGTGTLTTLNLRDLTVKTLRWKPRASCRCGVPHDALPPVAHKQTMEAQKTTNGNLAPRDVSEWAPEADFAGLPLIDVRESHEIVAGEYDMLTARGAGTIVHVPLSQLRSLDTSSAVKEVLRKLDGTIGQKGGFTTVLVLCAHGVRSRGFARMMTDSLPVPDKGTAVTGKHNGSDIAFRSIRGGIAAVFGT